MQSRGFSEHGRSVGAVCAVGRNDFELVIDTIGGVRSRAVVRPVGALVGEVLSEERAHVGAGGMQVNNRP